MPGPAGRAGSQPNLGLGKPFREELTAEKRWDRGRSAPRGWHYLGVTVSDGRTVVLSHLDPGRTLEEALARIVSDRSDLIRRHPFEQLFGELVSDTGLRI